MSKISEDQLALGRRIMEIRGGHDSVPDASIVIPVNAQGDLDNVIDVLSDCSQYHGDAKLEFVLVVNNYAAHQPPSAIQMFRNMNVEVVAIPTVRKSGEAVGFSARIPGARAAKSSTVILFDADCRIPQPTRLVDWYRKQFNGGARAAYTSVGYYDYQRCVSLGIRFGIHHLARWSKRNLLGIPTTRGSNYAVHRDVLLNLYDQGMLADEMNVGPTFKRQGHRVVYSGNRDLRVLTSGRMFRPGWLRMIPYYWYRLRYNMRTLPVRAGVAQHTGRENDPVRRYLNNRPLS